MIGSDQPRGRDDHSNPPRATDAEDERWVGEGGGSGASAHGAGKDGRDDDDARLADTVDCDDPSKTEKLITFGSDDDPDEGSD